MKLLLDSHTLIWAITTPKTLSRMAREAIGSDTSAVFVSIATLWELRIKEALKKVSLPKNFYDSLEPAGFEILSIALPHILAVGKLPNHHRDPFDRMLIAQARCEELTLVTRDADIQHYSVRMIRA